MCVPSASEEYQLTLLWKDSLFVQLLYTHVYWIAAHPEQAYIFCIYFAATTGAMVHSVQSYRRHITETKHVSQVGLRRYQISTVR